MLERWHGRNPLRSRGGLPVANHISGRFYEFVAKTFLRIFSVSHQLAPARVSPNRKSAPLLNRQIGGDYAGEFVVWKGVVGPTALRLDYVRQFLQEARRASDQRGWANHGQKISAHAIAAAAARHRKGVIER